MEEQVKTFRDLDTETLVAKLKANIYHRDATQAKVEELNNKQKRLLAYVERQKVALEQKIASLEALRVDRYEELECKKMAKVRAMVNYDNVIEAYTEELASRDTDNCISI